MSDEMPYCEKDKNAAVVDCQDDKASGYSRSVTKLYSNCVKLEIMHCNMGNTSGDYYAAMKLENESKIVISNLPSAGTLTVKFYANRRDYYLEATDGKKTVELKYDESETPGTDLAHAVTKTAVFNSTAKSITITPKGDKAITITDISVTPK